MCVLCVINYHRDTNKSKKLSRSTFRHIWVKTTESNVYGQNYWGFEPCPSSDILTTRELNVWETGSVFILRRVGDSHEETGNE
jgi:hypothetical protein